MKRRGYQGEALKAFTSGLRMFALLWERQSGKSTTFADMALFEMMRFVNRTVIYASASLLLAQEIVLKQTQRVDVSSREIIEKEAGVLAAAAGRYAGEAEKAGMLFRVADSVKGRPLTPALSPDGGEGEEKKGRMRPDDFAELFEQQRLEFRVYHDRTRYSRTKVIAPNIATARGWTGTVIMDEIAFIRGLRELITALTPIISTNRDFKLIYGTTPPEFDDTHYSFELLSPPAGMEFKPNAAGNWYESEAGVRVHRADAFDTHAAGKKIYDLRSGEEITPEEAFRKALNKDGHRIAHFLAWMIGGAAACDLLRLKVAQERGASARAQDQCRCVIVDSDADVDRAMAWLEGVYGKWKMENGKFRTGLGFDVATTTKSKSNPSVLSVVEEHGPEVVVRLLLVWKTKDPDVATERIERVVRTVTAGHGRPRALAIDATNERYFAEAVRKQFRAEVPVLLVVGSEAVEKPGLDKPTNYKELLGGDYIAKLDDNRLTLPPEQYVRIDHRLVRKDRGKFVCEPDEEGRHGDTFDGGKLGLFAVNSKRGGDAVAMPARVGEEIETMA